MCRGSARAVSVKVEERARVRARSSTFTETARACYESSRDLKESNTLKAERGGRIDESESAK